MEPRSFHSSSVDSRTVPTLLDPGNLTPDRTPPTVSGKGRRTEERDGDVKDAYGTGCSTNHEDSGGGSGREMVGDRVSVV